MVIWIVAAETIEGGKLFNGGNYLRKYGSNKQSTVFEVIGLPQS